MKKKLHTYRSTELAARITLMVQERQTRDPHFLMGELAEAVTIRYGCSRACAFRHLRLAIDVLGIAYDFDGEREKRRRERRLDGTENASVYGSKAGLERPGVVKNQGMRVGA